MTEIHGQPNRVEEDLFTGDMILTWHSPYRTSDRTAAVLAEVRVPPAEQLAFLARLATAVQRNLTLVGQQIATGACVTCSNSRMVDRPNQHGRLERQHCPDCRDRSRRGCRYPQLVPAVGCRSSGDEESGDGSGAAEHQQIRQPVNVEVDPGQRCR